jgi:hypothetical protein
MKPGDLLTLKYPENPSYSPIGVIVNTKCDELKV